MKTSLSDITIEAINNGQLTDPFSVFGVHQQNNGFVVRTFQPTAQSIELIDESGDPFTMTSI